jgi:DNA-binding CsgD family transcriptional regulator
VRCHDFPYSGAEFAVEEVCVAAAELLWEREGVLAAVGRALDEAQVGRGASLFVIAEAGLGKTAALDAACELAGERRFAVGIGRGNAMESALPFGVFAEALAGLGGREVFEREALKRSGPDVRAAQFYAALRWLEGFATAPVLVALDDLHWADADSLALVSFLCRRLRGLRAAVIAALRPYPPSAEELAAGLAHDGHASIERLAPLTRVAAAALFEARANGRLEDDAVRRAWDVCAGNPLLLEQLALAVGRGEDIPKPTDAGSSVSEELLLARFAGLSAVGMRCAQAASVFGSRFRPEFAVRLAQLSDADADSALDALGRSGLVRQADAGGVEFVHPLFRQALYEDLAAPIRTRLHGRAFTLLRARGLEAEAAEHAIRAELAGDAEAVALLGKVGQTALRAGALETAITILEAGVELARDEVTSELLVDYAEALVLGGRPSDAIAVYQRVVDRPELAPMPRAHALRMFALGLYFTGSHEAAAARFEKAAELATDIDPAYAVDTLISYAATSWFAIGPAQARVLANRAREIAQACDVTVRRQADAAWAMTALETGDPQGLELGAAAAKAVEADPVATAADVRSAFGVLMTYASAAKYAERLVESDHYYTTALRTAEELGLPGEISAMAIAYADTLIRRLRLRDALTFIERSTSLADLVPTAEVGHIGHALVLLLMGRLEESDAWAERVEPVITLLGSWTGSLWLSHARAWRALAEGHLDEACALYADMEATTLRAGVGEPCEVPWAGHAIAAYVASGREDDARRVIAWLEGCAERLPCRWPGIAAATGRARLAESAGAHDAADRLFQSALELHDEVDLPLERFQTFLEYGKYLRRAGQPRRARPLLADALDLAEANGAGWLASQARDELHIAGGRRRQLRDEPGRLTAQEQRVATLAAAGATTPEIARQLYLSASTIETHLEHIYAKLAIHSRRELMAMGDAISTEIPGSH